MSYTGLLLRLKKLRPLPLQGVGRVAEPLKSSRRTDWGHRLLLLWRCLFSSYREQGNAGLEQQRSKTVEQGKASLSPLSSHAEDASIKGKKFLAWEAGSRKRSNAVILRRPRQDAVYSCSLEEQALKQTASSHHIESRAIEVRLPPSFATSGRPPKLSKRLPPLHT